MILQFLFSTPEYIDISARLGKFSGKQKFSVVRKTNLTNTEQLSMHLQRSSDWVMMSG